MSFSHARDLLWSGSSRSTKTMMKIIKLRLKDAEAETIAISRSPSCSLRFQKSLLCLVPLFSLPFSIVSSLRFSLFTRFNRSFLFQPPSTRLISARRMAAFFLFGCTAILMGCELKEKPCFMKVTAFYIA